MSRSKTVLGAALLFGFLAALAGYAGLQAMARQVRAGASKEFVPVVVSATDLTFGTKLDRAQLRVSKYPKESVPAGAFSTIDSVAGQTTKIFLAAREPVTATKLSSRGGGLSMLIHSGYRATRADLLRQFVLQQDQFWTSELLIEGLRHRIRLMEVPITIRARAGGKSKKPKSFKYGWHFTKAIIQTWLR